jgi:hypothetical protein
VFSTAAAIAPVMVVMAIKYAFNFGCRGGQYTRAERSNVRESDGQGDHNVRVCDLTITFADGASCQGGAPVHNYCRDTISWHTVRATVRHLTSKSSDGFTGYILERTSAEKEFLRELVHFMCRSGATDDEPLFSYVKRTVRGQRSSVTLLRRHVAVMLKDEAEILGLPRDRIRVHGIRKGANMCGRMLGVSLEERKASLSWAPNSKMPSTKYDIPSFEAPVNMPPSVKPPDSLRGYYAWVRSDENLEGLDAEQVLGLTQAQIYSHTGGTAPTQEGVTTRLSASLSAHA